MKVRDLAQETLSALDSNRARSLLTILGIVIGIGAVIAMTSLIGGIKQSMVGEMGLNQARMVNIGIWLDREVTLEDIEALEELMPEYECITAATWASAKANSQTKSADLNIEGVLPTYFKVQGLKLSDGSAFTQDDQASSAMVVLLDQNAVKSLFGKPDEKVVGESIQLNNVSYVIKGVIEASPSSYGDGNAYLPFSTCASRLTGTWAVANVSGLASEDADLSTIADTTKAVLKDYFHLDDEEAEDNLYVTTMQSVIDELNTMMASFELMMTAVASISLLVGGIGIMNMMLTNVTERIREIGLRKALGAHSSDITKQFLLESVCLCVVGGAFGILVGYFGSYLLTGIAGDMFTTGGAEGVKPVIDMKSILMATGICVGIGVLFGYYPARRAAKLDPVESLHYQ